MGTAEVAAVTAAESVLGTLDAEGGEGKGGGTGFSGEGCWGEIGHVSLLLEETGAGVYGVGARNSPISVELPDRPQRTLLLPEVELERETKRQTAEREIREEELSARCPQRCHQSRSGLPSTDFSASPFHRWNTGAEEGEEKCPTSDAKGVSGGGARP